MSEEVLATAVLVLYHHVSGDWKPFKGDSNSKSTATLVSKGKFSSFAIKIHFMTTNENLLSCTLTPSTTIKAQPGFNTFFLLFDGKAYWGLSFSDQTVGSIFVEKTHHCVQSLTDGVKPAKSMPVTSTSAAAKLKSPKTPSSPSSSSSSSTTTNDTISSSSSRAGSLPTTNNKKMSSTVSEAVIKTTTPPTKPTRATTSYATPPLALASNPSSPAMSSVKRSIGSHSVPNSPAISSSPTTSSDDSQLPSSPSSRGLKRPEVAARKRSGTALGTSDDSLPSKTKAEKPQREKIIDELLKTEEDYVDSLTLIREKYLLPLKYAPRLGVIVFKPGDLEKIMYGIEPIYVLNTALLSDLRSRKQDGTIYDSCGATLHGIAPSMKLYIDYVNKYDNTIKMIADYESFSPVFKSFLTATSEDPESSGRGIRDFWIMPVQRIPRYALLMGELLKYTTDTHADYPHIKSALAQFQEIASYINDRKKSYDSQEKVAHLQQRLNPKCVPVMRERRACISEGIVYLKNPLFIPPKKCITVKKGKPEPLPEALGLTEIEFFLMNDLVLWAIKDPKHPYLNELGRIAIHELILCEDRPAYSVPFYDNTSMYKGFTIRTQDHNEETAPVFYCSDPVTCDKWVTIIKDSFLKAATARASELERLAKANLPK